APWLSYELLLIAVLIGGIFALPAFTIIRLALSHLVGREHHRTAFALDSVVIELSFVIGPALGVLIALGSTTWALISLGACAALAGIGLIHLDPPMRSEADREVASQGSAESLPGVDTPPEKPNSSRFRLTRPLAAVMSAAVGVTLVLAGTDVALIAALRATDQLSWTGFVAGAWAIASVIGGLAYGALRRPIGPFKLLLGLGLLTVPVGLVSGPMLLSVAILPAGLLCAAALSATTEVLTELVPEEIRGEAMGWHGSALLVGSAIGAPLAGFAIDHLAIWAGFAVVGLAGAVLAAGGLLARRRRPVRQLTGPVSFSPGP
ncbi:MAG: MFS transporter, partial [Angustibacter sp.]